MTTATLSKWGNGQGILIPKRFREQLGLEAGDKVSISLDKDRIVIERPEEQYTLEARVRNWDGKGKAMPELDWGAPVGEEMW